MVATIEAKATHRDVSAVIDCQGKDYARNIRDEDKVYRLGDWYGFKVPLPSRPTSDLTQSGESSLNCNLTKNE